jgi:glycosyltransferase involved in cell wall biosynthesis
MIGYPLLLKLLDKIVKKKSVEIKVDYEPTVSIIIPAHNEEKVIGRKLDNLLSLSYPIEKLEIIVTSDNSSDKTNEIVRKYSKMNRNVKLLEVKNRLGKTNAQDEAVEVAEGEVLLFSDANSILDKNAVNEIVDFLSDDKIGYVAGKLEYTNGELNEAAKSEEQYWNYDLQMRKIESDISSITAGNGAIYGVKKIDYEAIDPIYSHDSVFPPKFVLKGKRAVFNPNAKAYEKAGESLEDEFKRKVRMSRKIIKINFINMDKYNFMKHGYFSLFYFSHRFCRNFLFLFHMLLLISSLLLSESSFYFIFFLAQAVFFIFSLIGFYKRKSAFKACTYYSMTILAQIIGAYKEITGKSKPFWERASSTR